MVHPEQVISIRITKDQADRAKFHAQLAEVGGQSHIREREEREQELATDQMIGQLGQVGLHLYLYGNLHQYEASREMQNRYPTTGDGGFDVPGLTLDVKTSLVRSADLPLVKYHLAVRPKERHDDSVYVLALVQSPHVHLVGWLSDAELPEHEIIEGVFKGAKLVRGDRLHPLPPWRYSWLNYGQAA